MTTYVVLGLKVEALAWRRRRGIAPRDVIVVSPVQYTGALRGRSLDFELITLGSWSRASARVRRLVERDLEIIRATRPREVLGYHWTDPSTGAAKMLHPDDVAVVTSGE
jgi:hypothetical protein